MVVAAVAALLGATSPLLRSLHGSTSPPRLLPQLQVPGQALQVPGQAPPGSDCLPPPGVERRDADDGSLPPRGLDSDCRTSTGRLFCSAGLIIMTSPPRGSGPVDSAVAGLPYRQLLPVSDQRVASRPPPPPLLVVAHDADDE